MVLFAAKCQHGQVGPTCIECYRLALGDEQDKTRELQLQVSDLQKKLVEALCRCGPRTEVNTSLHTASCEYVKSMTGYPLCECGHNHRTEPGHYVTMNCNSPECACTYYTEKRKEEPECNCMIPYLEGAGQHSPKCAIFKKD